jgi:hypothetical protein
MLSSRYDPSSSRQPDRALTGVDPGLAYRLISPAKITGYLLNEAHPIGRTKARFFAAFGFSLEHWEVFAAALLQHPVMHPVSATTRTSHGVTFTVRCSIPTPDGRDPCILTVWLNDGSGPARLVTAYPSD